ncbi:MAG: leucine-rich repeat domain-containing protein [Lachnospiraceae bacterium]|nr:leucine-rich repeat domain-containing protein [Lachnospiraceae bacterium]
MTELNMERVVGENPDTQINCDNSHVDVEVHWINGNNGRDIDTFTPGQIVELQVYFFPQSGYKFGDSPSPEFYINGSNVTIEPRYVNNNRLAYAYIINFGKLSKQIPKTVEITDLDLTVSHGKTLDTEFNVSCDNLSEYINWTDVYTNCDIQKSLFYTKPSMVLMLECPEDYEILLSTVVKLNGATVVSDPAQGLTVSVEYNRITITKEYDMLSPTASDITNLGIGEVNINMPGILDGKVEIGKNADTSFTCQNDRVNVTVSVVDTADENAAISAYQPYQQPAFIVKLTPKGNYFFTDAFDLYINNSVFLVSANTSTNYFKETKIPFSKLYKGLLKNFNVNGIDKPKNGSSVSVSGSSQQTGLSKIAGEWLDHGTQTKAESIVGGYEYDLHLVLEAEYGYAFEDNGSIALLANNGIPYLTLNKSGCTFAYSANLDKLEITTNQPIVADCDKLNSISVFIAEPEIDAVSNSGNFVSTDSGYKYIVYFYDNDSHQLLQSGARFQSGHKYYMNVTFIADDGYELSSDVYDKNAGATVKVNGNDFAVDDGGDANGTSVSNILYTCTHLFDDGEETTKATCENTGVKTCHCTLCQGEKKVDIPALGHSLTFVEKKEATTDSAGHAAYYECSRCHKLFTDKDGKNSVTEESLRIPAVNASGDAPEVIVEKGKKVKDPESGNGYKVLNVTGETASVEFKAPKKNAKNVTIPAEVKIGTVKCKVVKISANAFKNNKSIRSVVIGKNVKNIGARAFYGCSNLKNIKINTTKLTNKTVGKNAFARIHKKATAKVPKKKLKSYKKMLKAKGMKKATQKITK